MSHEELKKRRREDYGYVLEYRTRWSDNDMYDHMNNSIYNFLYDSIVNSYLIEHCGLNPPTSSQYGLVVHSHALRVNKLGKSSVTYEIALFERGVEEVKSVGQIIHVFVDRKTGRPAAQGMNATIKEGLQRISTRQSKL
ncbi:hypothetical protein EYC84_001157 [Monilinia fructicola]|uniref:Acyl-ACP thioesterase-like C-terminal domain-containing protein n=1 Tax=Monilinia fructicola TaxID=38448 RepID=A0A5M9JNH5_MONFR|nr:hypothetical protein EYC84_001157 [Monilinia fructicola]